MSERSAIVIGAGIVGLAVSRALALRGYSVKVFERNARQIGASVRNFGMIWPVGQAGGKMFERAMISRSIWKEICTEAGIWHSEKGSLHLAYDNDELDVLNEFAEEGRYYRKCEMLSASTARARSAYINEKELLGALWSETELIVDARKAIPAVATWLTSKFNVEFNYNTAISKVDYPAVYSGKRLWQADEIFVCSGADFETLYPELFLKTAITKCKLQMMRLAPVAPSLLLGPSLCGGLSLIHYAGFSVASSLAALRKRLTAQMPDLIKWGIHVMITQNGEGEFVVGDSHEYGLAPDPFDKAFINQMILGYLKRFTLLGDQSVVASWNGVYPKLTDGRTEFIAHPEHGVTILNGLGGAGMTLSFGLAENFISKGKV